MNCSVIPLQAINLTICHYVDSMLVDTLTTYTHHSGTRQVKLLLMGQDLYMYITLEILTFSKQ